MEELKAAMGEHMDQIADLVEKLTAEFRSRIRPAHDNFLGFFHAIDWTTQNTSPHASLETSIDQGPYINLTGGMVAAMGNELVTNDVVEMEDLSEGKKSHDRVTEEIVLDSREGQLLTGVNPNFPYSVPSSSKQFEGAKGSNSLELSNPIRRCLNKLFWQNRTSIWLLGYIAIVSTWLLLGAVLQFVFKKKLKSVLPANKA